MPEFLNKNRELHTHMGNIEFLCEDVLSMDQPDSSFDMVFSCWLQMYLADEEVLVL